MVVQCGGQSSTVISQYAYIYVVMPGVYVYGRYEILNSKLFGRAKIDKARTLLLGQKWRELFGLGKI